MFGAGWIEDANGVVVSDGYKLSEGLALTWYPSRGGCRAVNHHAHPAHTISSHPAHGEGSCGGSVHTAASIRSPYVALQITCVFSAYRPLHPDVSSSAAGMHTCWPHPISCAPLHPAPWRQHGRSWPRSSRPGTALRALLAHISSSHPASQSCMLQPTCLHSTSQITCALPVPAPRTRCGFMPCCDPVYLHTLPTSIVTLPHALQRRQRGRRWLLLGRPRGPQVG